MPKRYQHKAEIERRPIRKRRQYRRCRLPDPRSPRNLLRDRLERGQYVIVEFSTRRGALAMRTALESVGAASLILDPGHPVYHGGNEGALMIPWFCAAEFVHVAGLIENGFYILDTGEGGPVQHHAGQERHRKIYFGSQCGPYRSYRAFGLRFHFQPSRTDAIYQG